MGGGTDRLRSASGARTASPDGTAPAIMASVGPGFFTTMRIPLHGRDFSERESPALRKWRSSIGALARSFGLENPVGRTMTIGDESFEIVGVAGDALTLDAERREPGRGLLPVYPGKNGHPEG